MPLTYFIENFSYTGKSDSKTLMRGWIVAPFPLQKIILLQPGKGCLSIEVNQCRPDVAAVFPEVSHAGNSGFTIELPLRIEPSNGVMAILQGKRENNNPRDLLATLDLSTNSPQRLEDEEGGFQSIDLEQKLKLVHQVKPGITLRLDIINKCNLRCIMCHYSNSAYFKRKARRISLDEFKDFFDSIAPMVKDIMLSCSDEPLLSPHFLTIVEHIATNFPHVEMEFCTNAMLLNENIRRGIIEHGVTYLMCSLDAATKETLEAIRVGSNYEKIVSNILALTELKNQSGTRFPRVISNFVMMEKNIHEAPKFVEMCSELGVNEIDFRHVVPGDYWNDSKQFLQNHPAKYNCYRTKILGAAENADIQVFIPDALPTNENYAADDPKVTLDDFRNVSPAKATDSTPVKPKQFATDFMPRNILGTAADIFSDTFCQRPFSEISIFDQEIVRPCPFHKVALGNQSEGETLNGIFFGERFKEVRKNMYRPEGDTNCQGCPVKGNYFGIQ